MVTNRTEFSLESMSVAERKESRTEVFIYEMPAVRNSIFGGIFSTI